MLFSVFDLTRRARRRRRNSQISYLSLIAIVLLVDWLDNAQAFQLESHGGVSSSNIVDPNSIRFNFESYSDAEGDSRELELNGGTSHYSDHQHHHEDHELDHDHDPHLPPPAASSSHHDYPETERYENKCADSVTGRSKKCMPEFVNAAYGLKIHASNTCGVRQASEFCVQSNLHNQFFSRSNSNPYSADGPYGTQSVSNSDGSLRPVNSRCQKCDANDRRYSHPPEFLNDYNLQNNLTWWQSETMLEGIQYPNSVNLTLHLGKSFDINYVQIKFQSSRPESFAIYKRTSETGPWIPYQYYSASCRETYGVNPDQIVTHDNEAIALCTDEFSDIAPLAGASVVFGTLEDRPSAYNFENSDQLKEWVTATDIRITLNRLNTFGDEVFNDPHVLKSYYYAISDIAVGGRCKCNGHASNCSYQQQEDFEDRLVCACEHNTAGVDCQECAPFFNDVPWAPATQFDAHECKPCSCNGLSKKCHFNQTLYDLTGHGGYCDDCEGNTGGPNCEECKVGFYRRENENRCIDCQCNPYGSESVQCDPSGKCRCKPGVVGEKCDRCAPYHYELSITGCKMCSCNAIGSFDRPPICDPRDGNCRCKANVEGQNCDRPKPGFFNLAEENLHGALPCFCYGHSSMCNSSGDFYVHPIEAAFDESVNWQAIDAYNNPVKTDLSPGSDVSVDVQSSHEDIWLLAPKPFLGNQLNSYGQDLTFELQLVDLNQLNYVQSARPSRKDIVLYSAQYNLEVYMPIYGASSGRSSATNPLPNNQPQQFTFKLDQHSGWMPTLSSHDFQRLLTNLSSIKIRASYAPSTKAILSELKLISAQRYSPLQGRDFYKAAMFVEECKCPVGHVGQHCELCAEGYRREPINGGPFARCVPCSCNNHSVSCDANTGRCSCLHHTSGDNCEKCKDGYYGNPIPPQVRQSADEPIHQAPSQPLTQAELANMCKKCPCPNDGPCAEIFNYLLNTVEVVCLACPDGTQGNRCELCDDGYFRPGNSLVSSCERCDCNGNVDENAVGNCDTQSSIGRCLRCVYNTTGDKCEKCLPNYWGNALSSVKCHSCDCFAPGTYEADEDDPSRVGSSLQPRQCDLNDGQCECKPNVKNRQCNECKEGFWNILSGKGCEECRCNPLGSYNLSCNSLTGQCHCRPGVQGLKCDSCQPLWYGFSDEGCKKCHCDAFGTDEKSLMQCDDFGKCKCKDNFAGLKCDRCAENRYNYTSGCLECDQCYNLVQDGVNALRSKIYIIQMTLKEMLANSSNTGSGGSGGGDESTNNENIELQNKLNSLKEQIEQLHMDLFERKNLKPTYKESIAYLQSELKSITETIKNTDQLFEQFNVIFKQAQGLYNQANQSVVQIETQLSFIDKNNEERRDKLESIKQTRLDHEQNIKLQQFAKQARETADMQKQIAHNASNDLRVSIDKAYETFRHLEDMLNRYEILEKDKENPENFAFNYELLKQTTTGYLQEAQEQKKILDENNRDMQALIEKIVKFKIPDEKESDKLNENTKNLVAEISAKSYTLKKEIDDLKSKFEQFAEVDSLNSIGSAQNQLNTAQIKQKDVDFLFGMAERLRNETERANKLAEEVFKNATNILETLEKFDELISEGKRKVQEAEQLKTTIDDNLIESKNLANEYNEKLNALNVQLAEIKSISSKSKNLLADASNGVEKFNQKASELNTLTSKLEALTSDLKNNYESSTESKANEAFNVFSNLNARSESILKQAEHVTNGTQKLLDNANNAIESLNRINKSLTEFSVSNIRREEIVRLQRKFDQISSQLDNDYQIDESINNLEKSTKDLLNTAKQYQYQVQHLREQVENLERINNSLERKCFKNTITNIEF